MQTVSKKVKATYWVSTILIAIPMIMSLLMVNAPESIATFEHLGVGATWFRWELEIAKTLAGIVLVLPFIRGKIKEIAYIGIGIDIISAFIAMMTVDGFAKSWFVLIFLAILAVSYWSYHRIQGTKTTWY